MTPEKDLVEEARALLGSGALLLPLRVEGWHKSLTDGGWFVRHSTGRTLATVEFVPVEIETGRPALNGNAPARVLVALLNAMPALCDEVDQLREDKKLLGERLEAQAETLSRMAAAIEAARPFVDAVQCCHHNCTPESCSAEGQRRAKQGRIIAAQLKAALTPKG